MTSTNPYKALREDRRETTIARRREAEAERFGRRQPRPRPRRTGTRQGVLAAAMREG